MKPNTIAEFLESRETQAYFGYEDAMIYLRKSIRWVDDERGMRPCLNLSSITRESRRDNMKYDPEAVSTGFMAQFMSNLEREARRFGMDPYVERVVNEWLPEWLEERGYQQVEEPNPPSFHLPEPGEASPG